MIVEDSRLVADKMKNLLKESLGVDQVDIAGNFQQGLRYVQYLQPELVLLDIQLPDGNGLELLRIINKDYPDIRVIVVSNHSSDNYRAMAMSLGANHFFDKSNEFEKIPYYV